MITPTRELPMHLSMEADVNERALDGLITIAERVSDFNSELHSVRESRFHNRKSVFNVDENSELQEDYSVVPDAKLEEVRRVNDIKWNQVFESILSGKNPSVAVSECSTGRSRSSGHFRFGDNDFTCVGEKIWLSFDEHEMAVRPDEPVYEGDINFDQLIIKGLKNARKSSCSPTVQLKFVNTESPRQYSYEKPTVGDRADAELFQELNLNENSQKERGFNMIHEKYDTGTAIQLMLFIEGEIDAARFEYSSTSSPAFGEALTELEGVFSEHIPQEGIILLTRREIDFRFSGIFPGKQSLSESEKYNVLQAAGYPVDGTGYKYSQNELIARKFSRNEVSEQDVEDFKLCHWTPIMSNESDVLQESIRMGRKSRKMLETHLGDCRGGSVMRQPQSK
jgi:hypothetical protein